VVALTMILIERIQFHLPKMKITIPPAEILEFKEALIFALLAC
jgi:anhydro-N-acetylmuramic acid kinase